MDNLEFHDRVAEDRRLISVSTAESGVQHYVKLLDDKHLSSTGLLNQSWTLTKSMEKSLDTCNSRILLIALNTKTTYYEH